MSWYSDPQDPYTWMGYFDSAVLKDCKAPGCVFESGLYLCLGDLFPWGVAIYPRCDQCWG